MWLCPVTPTQTYFEEAQGQQWFREKYHPDLCDARIKALNDAARRRLLTFTQMHAQARAVQHCHGWVTPCTQGAFEAAHLTSDNLRVVHEVMERINDALDLDGAPLPPPPVKPPPPPAADGAKYTPVKVCALMWPALTLTAL